jgi:hypothetical protein
MNSFTNVVDRPVSKTVRETEAEAVAFVARRRHVNRLKTIESVHA